MIVRAKIEVLPEGAIPAYDFELTTDVVVYDFEAEAWVKPRVVARELGQTPYSLECPFERESDLEPMLVRAFDQSPSFEFFIHIALDRSKVGMWTANGHLHEGTDWLVGIPEDVARDFYPSVLARKIMES